MILTSSIIDGNGNTRPKPIDLFSVHLDYLRIRGENVTTEEFENVLNFLSEGCTTQVGQPWSPGGGAVWYPNKLIGIHGFVGGYDLEDEGGISYMIDLSGAFWEQLNLIESWRLLMGLTYAFTVKCSRIDIAIDDSTYSRIPVRKMREAWERGQNFHFRKHTYIESGETPEELCKTWNFGSRESGKFTRIYDHEGECLRHEVEFKRQFAHEVFLLISKLERPIINPEHGDVSNNIKEFTSIISKQMASIALGAIDFRDRGSREDLSRAGVRDSTRLSFYQEYIDEVCDQSYRVIVPKPSRSLTGTVNWMKNQVSATLSMMKQGLGVVTFHVWLRELLDYGADKHDSLKDLWIAEMKRNPKVVRI